MILSFSYPIKVLHLTRVLLSASDFLNLFMALTIAFYFDLILA